MSRLSLFLVLFIVLILFLAYLYKDLIAYILLVKTGVALDSDYIALPNECQVLADKKWWGRDEPIPFCANSKDPESIIGCQAMSSSGKCEAPYGYGLCPGNFRFSDGECV